LDCSRITRHPEVDFGDSQLARKTHKPRIWISDIANTPCCSFWSAHGEDCRSLTEDRRLCGRRAEADNPHFQLRRAVPTPNYSRSKTQLDVLLRRDARARSFPPDRATAAAPLVFASRGPAPRVGLNRACRRRDSDVERRLDGVAARWNVPGRRNDAKARNERNFRDRRARAFGIASRASRAIRAGQHTDTPREVIENQGRGLTGLSVVGPHARLVDEWPRATEGSRLWTYSEGDVPSCPVGGTQLIMAK
jgi:hypothetical protein